MRTKRRAIIKLSFILLAIVVGLILCFVPFKVAGTNYTWKSIAGDIKLGSDLKGGVYAVYDIAEGESTDNIDARLDATVNRLLAIVQSKGYPEATVVREGDTRIRVEVPDVASPDKLFRLLGEPADMQFKVLDSNQEVKETLTSLTGKNVKNAAVGYQEGKYGVSIQFDDAGATEFGRATESAVGGYIQILVSRGNSEYEVLTTASVSEAIYGGSTFISGSFTYESADELAQQLLAGAFDVKLNCEVSEVMSASLGEEALKYSLIAGAIALAGIIIYLCVVYRGMGIVSGIALLIYMILYIFLLWSFPWVQLSLPGIAGIILSLGMAVDANVIIFERIKEEYALGKSINASVHAGFKKSLWTVLDANITTILASIVLIVLGTGTIQGFGITLLMGIVISLLTAVLISRGLFKIMLAINKYDNRFYGLKREEGVVEQPDEEPAKKAKKNEVEGIPFDEAVREAARSEHSDEKLGGEQA